eukprot:11637933-Ditylum_brightwellii.AAC.1
MMEENISYEDSLLSFDPNGFKSDAEKKEEETNQEHTEEDNNSLPTSIHVWELKKVNENDAETICGSCDITVDSTMEALMDESYVSKDKGRRSVLDRRQFSLSSMNISKKLRMKSSKSVASKYTSTTNGAKKKKHASGKSKSISTL